MPLDHQNRNLLISALTELYDQPTLETALNHEIDYRLTNLIALSAGMDNIVPAVVKDLEDKGILLKFVGAVLVTRAHPNIQAVHSVLVAQQAELAAYSPEDPFETPMVHGRRAFIDRSTLRNHARDLIETPFANRLLIVRGNDGCGKTYSKEFFFFLKEQMGTPAIPIETVLVDLEKIYARKQKKPIKVLDVAQSMVSQIANVELSESLQNSVGSEQDSEWAGQFTDWLTGKLNEQNSQYWIIVDGLDDNNCVVEDGVTKLIDELGDQVVNNLDCVKLILLGYQGPLLNQVDEDYGYDDPLDDITDPSNNHRLARALGVFFANLYKLKDPAITDPKLKKKMTEDVQSIFAAFDPSKPGRFRSLNKMLRDRANAILR